MRWAPLNWQAFGASRQTWQPSWSDNLHNYFEEPFWWVFWSIIIIVILMFVEKESILDRFYWWSSNKFTTSSNFTLLHNSKNFEVDCFINIKWRFSWWCVSVLSKVRLCSIFSFLFLFFSWIDSSFNKFVSSYAISLHFLMHPQCVWQRVERKVLSAWIFWSVLCMCGTIWKTWWCSLKIF